MTTQMGDLLIYQSESLGMATEPLNDFFTFGGSKPRFARTSTALWRNYFGTWEIVNDRLYLIGLEATMMDGSPANLETVFPGFPDRVFAHWYSGELHVPRGKLLRYVHMGYSSTYEKTFILDIANGVVTDTRIVQNSIPDNQPDLKYDMVEFIRRNK